MALQRAFLSSALVNLIDPDMAFSGHFQGFIHTAKVDRVSAAAREFAADGAIAAIEGIGMVRFDAESGGAAVT